MKNKSFYIFLMYISIFINYSLLLADDCYREIHTKHFFGGMPQGVPSTNDLIIRDSYCLSSNDSTKFADWVAFVLDIPTITGTSIDRKWMADPWLEDNETLEPEDYKGANQAYQYDRGHQAPLANFKGNRDIASTNFLSNITPQKAELNQGVWKKLEDNERALTQKYGLVYVMTGPIYNNKKYPKLPNADEPHTVPSAYWKIIIIPINKDSIELFSFIMDQDTPRSSKLEQHLCKLDEIESKTKLRFLTEFSPRQKEAITKNIDFKWFNINFK